VLFSPPPLSLPLFSSAVCGRPQGSLKVAPHALFAFPVFFSFFLLFLSEAELHSAARQDELRGVQLGYEEPFPPPFLLSNYTQVR